MSFPQNKTKKNYLVRVCVQSGGAEMKLVRMGVCIDGWTNI